MIDMRVTSNIV